MTSPWGTNKNSWGSNSNSSWGSNSNSSKSSSDSTSKASSAHSFNEEEFKSVSKHIGLIVKHYFPDFKENDPKSEPFYKTLYEFGIDRNSSSGSSSGSMWKTSKPISSTSHAWKSSGSGWGTNTRPQKSNPWSIQDSSTGWGTK